MGTKTVKDSEFKLINTVRSYGEEKSTLVYLPVEWAKKHGLKNNDMLPMARLKASAFPVDLSKFDITDDADIICLLPVAIGEKYGNGER